MEFDKQSQKNFREYDEIGKEFLQNDPSYLDFEYVPLYPVHPDITKSIEINQLIQDSLVNLNQAALENLINKYNCYDIVDKYYLCKYGIQYFSSSTHNNKILEGKIFERGQESFESLEDYLKFQKEQGALISVYKEKLAKRGEFYSFFRLRSHHLKKQMQRLKSSKYEDINLDYMSLDEYTKRTPWDYNKLRVDISSNPEKYLSFIRKTLLSYWRKEEGVSQIVEAFIYNSFSFENNSLNAELLSFPIHSKGKFEELIHQIYTKHGEMVKNPSITRVDFAGILYLNFQHIRERCYNSLKKDPSLSIKEVFDKNISRNI